MASDFPFASKTVLNLSIFLAFLNDPGTNVGGDFIHLVEARGWPTR